METGLGNFFSIDVKFSRLGRKQSRCAYITHLCEVATNTACSAIFHKRFELCQFAARELQCCSPLNLPSGCT